MDGEAIEVALREGETILLGLSIVVGNGFGYWIHNAHARKYTAGYVLSGHTLRFVWMETKGS